MAAAGPVVRIRFDSDFACFLSKGDAGRLVELRPGHETTVKDLVESCGVPHVEIGYLLKNGTLPALFSTRVADGDCFDVLPVEPSVAGLVQLQPDPGERVAFIADLHLGSAARRLRLLGFDTAWFTGRDDEGMLDIMEAEGRILLTRDRRLLMRNRVRFGCCIRSDNLLEQVRQVVRRYGLREMAEPFSRCIACNGLLEATQKAQVRDRLPELTRRFYEAFRECSGCGKVYWQGAHMRRLRSFVEAALA